MPSPLSQHYSDRLGTLDAGQLQEALSRLELGAPLHAEPITAGLFGQNLFLSSDTGDYVLRGNPHSPSQFPGESSFARQLHEKTNVPVPWPYLYDSSTDIFGWSYVIMPRMPGVQSQDAEVRASLSPADRQAIARAMGAMAAEMHNLTWSWFGEYELGADSIKADDGDALHRAVGQVRAKLARAHQISQQTTRGDVVWVERLIERTLDADAAPGQPTSVHHDYREANAVVERRQGRWRVSGVFDLQEAYFGDAEEDLSRPMASYL